MTKAYTYTFWFLLDTAALMFSLQVSQDSVPHTLASFFPSPTSATHGKSWRMHTDPHYSMRHSTRGKMKDQIYGNVEGTYVPRYHPPPYNRNIIQVPADTKGRNLSLAHVRPAVQMTVLIPMNGTIIEGSNALRWILSMSAIVQPTCPDFEPLLTWQPLSMTTGLCI